MDDELIWAADLVVASTLGSAIAIPEITNEFAIKGNHLTLIKGNQFDGRTKPDPHKHIYEFLEICDMFKYKDIKNEAVCLMMFPLSLNREAKTQLDELNEGTIKTWDELRTAFISRFFPSTLFDRILGEIHAFSQHENESLIDASLRMKEMLRNCHARMDAMTMKMDAQYKELQSCAKQPIPDLEDDDIPMSREEEAKFMQTFCANINFMPYFLYAKLSLETLKPTKMSVRLADISFQYPVGIAKNILVEVGKFTFPANFFILKMEEDIKVPLILGRPFFHTANVVNRVKQKQLNLGVGTKRMIFNIDSAIKHSYLNDDTCFSIDVIDEILKEDFDALLDEGRKILYSIEGTFIKEEIFLEFDKFIAMTADENYDTESDTEELPFEKITINTYYKIKTSLEEPPMDLELKPLPDNLEY
nr:reverse transcriptase domain-containing protein [Tanacetum cinerariifolium]